MELQIIPKQENILPFDSQAITDIEACLVNVDRKVYFEVYKDVAEVSDEESIARLLTGGRIIENFRKENLCRNED